MLYLIKINEYDNIMRALKFKMITPPFSTKYIYDWTLFFWGFYKSEMAKQKLGWDKNIYIPKKK